MRSVLAAPGNPGMAAHAECIPLQSPSPQSYLSLAADAAADLTVVGPEAPLVAGTVDAFHAAGRPIVGPTQAAARLEGSKVFSKHFMHRAGIPTARYAACESYDEARRALGAFSFPVVLKADGLAAGKGVLIVHNVQEAEATLQALFSGALVGEAGRRVVVEEYLEGEEVSFIALTDGTQVLPLEATQDHKAVWDGDQGPNTGGMGAYCDGRILTQSQTDEIMRRIVLPTVERMAAEGHPFTGFLYAGLMLTRDGPRVLEYNVRLGDPEAQALLHRLDADFGALLATAASGRLGEASLAWRVEPSVCVVLASEGYPGKPRTGDPIDGIEAAEAAGATVFQAGTRAGQGGRLLTAGGRVLGVTSRGPTLAAAIDQTYAAVARIQFAGMHYRKDIGRKGLKRW